MEEVPTSEPLQGMDWLGLLPEDVQEMVLGLLDLPTLYTARLVCKRFRKFAAGHFKALDCTAPKELPTIDFRQFRRMAYLAVTVSHESHLESLADPKIGPVVTHVSLKGLHLRESQTAEVLEVVLMRLPKLRSVSLQPLREDLRLPLFPSRLEELKITDRHSLTLSRWRGVGDASPLTRCSQLTNLAIDLRVGPPLGTPMRSLTSMGSLSSLHNLRSLDLHSYASALRVLSTFTALTSLKFEEFPSLEDASVFQDLGRLTGLSQLTLVRVFTPAGVATHEDLTCIAQLTNLTCLDMRGCLFDGNIQTSTALVPLTRLVSLRLFHGGCMPLLSVPQVEALHNVRLLDSSDASVLQRATRLTHLKVNIKDPMCLSGLPGGLGPAVASITSLRSLVLWFKMEKEDHYRVDPGGGSVFRLDAILRACTMLTLLDYADWHLRPDRDLNACAALPGLRSLSFWGIRELTSDWLPALQAMSGLTELTLGCTGIRVADMTPDVIKAFDAKRREMGWPLLKLCVHQKGERSVIRLGH